MTWPAGQISGRLTLQQAADFLKLRPRQVLDYVHRGELEASRVRRRWRFRRAALDAFVAPSEWAFRVRNGHEE